MTNRLIIAALSLSVLTSCYKEIVVEEERPDGWGYLTHSDQVDPDYSTVFPQDEVNKMYIEITAEDWQTMQDDLDEMYGGSSGGPGGGGPGGGGAGFSDEKPVTVKCQVYF